MSLASRCVENDLLCPWSWARWTYLVISGLDSMPVMSANIIVRHCIKSCLSEVQCDDKVKMQMEYGSTAYTPIMLLNECTIDYLCRTVQDEVHTAITW